MTDDTEVGNPRRNRPGRKSRRRKKPVPGLLPRFALIALVVGFSAVACAAIASKVAEPYEMMHQEKRQIATLNAQLQATDAQNEGMERQAQYLERPDGAEEVARSKGYLKPGEISLIIATPAGTQSAPAPDSFADRMRRALSHLMGR